MSESMYADLLAAQKEMPNLQKTGINPHFKNRYVPLEELISHVVPVLNKHNFVLIQAPAFHESQPALTTSLVHTSGESVTTTMPLLCAKDDPQGQGSAITYARRYSLMAMLGLSADEDDDAETATKSAQTSMKGDQYVHSSVPRPAPRGGAERPATNGQPTPPPVCDLHGSMSFVKAGTAKATGKPYESFWSCPESRNGCRTATVNAGDWAEQVRQMAEPALAGVDHDVPFSE